MHRIAITNQKGGTGKTTTAVNLAACLAELGDRVLVVDLDGQAHATKWLGIDPDHDVGPTLYDVLVSGMDARRTIVESKHIELIDVLPGHRRLYTIEATLASEPLKEMLLKEALSDIDDYDWVLCDCPPAFGLLMHFALLFAPDVLVPIRPSSMPLEGVRDLVHTVAKIRSRLHSELEIIGVLPVEVDSRTNLSSEAIQALRDTFGDRLFETTIGRNVRLDEAFGAKEPITIYDAKSRGATDYRAAAKELKERIYG